MAEPSSTPEIPSADRCLRVLLVEDSPAVSDTLSRMIRMLLRPQAVEVDGAVSLAEARQRFRSGPYDLYILDNTLEDGTGLDLIPEIRAEPVGGPILFLSGSGDVQVINAALELGAAASLTKGQFSSTELGAALHRLLN